MDAKPKKTQPAIWHKVRRRVVEEIAMQQVCEMISPEGDLPLPKDWVTDAEHLRDYLLSLINDEVRTGVKF